MTHSRLARVAAGVPGSLADVQVELIAAGDETISYWLTCPCGGTHGPVTSEHDEAENFWLDPIMFTCADCNRSAVLFDSRIHGYDAVLNGGGTSAQRAQDQRVPCPQCGGLKHRVTVAFRYDLEEDELEELSANARLPDLFTSISFRLTCAACMVERHLSDFECA